MIDPTYAAWLVRVLYAYGIVGLMLLPWWHARGLRRLDHAAGAASWGVRMLISPGLVGLWPLLLRRGLTGDGRPPAERNDHRRAS